MANQASRVFGTVLVCMLVVVGPSTGRAETQNSNLDLLTSLTTEVVEELLTRLEDARGDRGVRLVPYANSEEYRFLETVFMTRLTERGVQVYKATAAGPGGDDNVVELQFQALEFSVVYPKIFRSYLIGGKHVRREADVTIIATLVDPGDGSVIRVEQASREGSDQFSHGDIGRVEQGNFSFVRPEMPPSGWARIVEPVFVSGIIVGLIYLFFSNQSDD